MTKNKWVGGNHSPKSFGFFGAGILFLCLGTLMSFGQAVQDLDDFSSGKWVGWAARENSKISLEKDADGTALRIVADYNKAAYSWAKRMLPKEALDTQKTGSVKSIRFKAKAEGMKGFAVTLVMVDGKNEVKFVRDVKAGESYSNYILRLDSFLKGGNPPSAAEYLRIESAMFSFVQYRGVKEASLWIRDLSLSEEEGPTAEDPNRPGTPPKIEITEAHRKDLRVIRDRLRETLVPEMFLTNAEPSDSAKKSLASLGDDGSWSDINYADRSRTAWAPMAHLDRLMTLAAAWVQFPANAKDKSVYKSAINRALAFWCQRDPDSENWWHNMIGAQLVLDRIALILDETLTPEQRSQIVRILARSSTDGMTGGNLTWTAGHTVVRGVIENNPAAAAGAFALIAKEIRMAPGEDEGVKADGTFHQHGQQLYNAGYGAAFSVDASRFMYYAAGTAFEFPKEKADVLATFALDGSRWMLWENVFDYSSRGREITRPSKGYRTTFLAEVCRNLRTQQGPRQKEIEAFYTELTNRKNSIQGNKVFWKSDYAVHRRSSWMVSVKMLSWRMQSGELVNAEGLRSHLLSDGLTYWYTGDGLAYHNIFPVWDWKRLPGITAEWSEDPPKGDVPSRGKTDFAGGVSDGTCGATGFIHERGELKARKSWFFFDDEAVALGSGIKGGSLPVNTTLDQCLKSSGIAVKVSGKESLLEKTSAFDGTLEWVHHRGLGFIFLEPSRVLLKDETRSGSWKDISTSASPEKVSAPVFTAVVDHGSAENGHYAYAVVPADLASFKAYAGRAPFKVLTNSPKLAAVEHAGKGVVEAIFYEAGTLTTSSGLRLALDGPGAILLKKTTDGYALTCADPTGKSAKLVVLVNRTWKGKSALADGSSGTKLSFVLPSGEEAGKNTTEIFVEKN